MRGRSRGGLSPEEAFDWLRLQRIFAWHPQLLRPLLEAGHDAEGILRRTYAAPEAEADSRAVWPAAVSRRLGAARGRGPEHDRRALDRIDARVLPWGHADYPASLAPLEDAPAVLLVRGRIAALSGPSVAIVGARAATVGARDQARQIARELAAKGVTVVSGLARGIDAEAHRGALEGNGRTVGVLASGLDRIYPPEHRGLADEITRRGAVIGEMPLGTSPRRELFPLRNRIISGLCLGVVVVEARQRSGSLITVRHALAQGREVFSVPGSSAGPFAGGSNQLLREGARAVQSAAEILEDLAAQLPERLGEERDVSIRRGRDRRNVCADASPSGRPCDGIEATILDQLAREPATREALLIRGGVDPGKLAGALLDLEWAGRIVEERDGRFHLRRG